MEFNWGFTRESARRKSVNFLQRIRDVW